MSTDKTLEWMRNRPVEPSFIDGKAYIIRTNAEAFLDRGGPVVEKYGIEELSLRGVGSHAATLFANRHVRQMRALLLGDIEDDGVSLLGDVEFPNLRELVLECNGLTASGVAGLAPLLGQLEVLDLGDNEIGDEGVSKLAAVPMPRLRRLRLYFNNIGASGASALAAAEVPVLRELDLGNHEGWVHRDCNLIGSDGCRALVASRWFATLEVLNLSGNGIDTEGALALAAVPLRARNVDLQYNRIGDGGASALAASWRVERIGLTSNQLVDENDLVDLYDPLDGAVLDQAPRPLTAVEIEQLYGFPYVY